MSLLLFLSTNTHTAVRGDRWGAPCSNVPVSLGWDISVETTDEAAPAGGAPPAPSTGADAASLSPQAGAPIGLRSLASGWNYLRGLEVADDAVKSEADARLLQRVQDEGVPPAVALAALQAAVDQAEADTGRPLDAVVAHNTEGVMAVLRSLPAHPLLERLLATGAGAVRRVCLCWDDRVRATTADRRPARFVDLCKKYGIERDPVGAPATNPVRSVARMFVAMRSDGTLGDVAAMAHDSDSRTPALYLSVPYGQRAEAKQLGAMFDGYKKRWYLPVSLLGPDGQLPVVPDEWLATGDAKKPAVAPKRPRDGDDETAV